MLAASPPNTQPWTFHVTDTAIDVSADPTRTIGTVEPLLREQHIGLGYALENLALGCAARGLRPTGTLLPDGVDGERVAHVALAPGGPPLPPSSTTPSGGGTQPAARMPCSPCPQWNWLPWWTPRTWWGCPSPGSVNRA